MKKCTKCGEIKPLTEYTWDTGWKDGRYKSSCKACGAQYMREKRQASPTQAREYVLQYHYGMSLAQYEKMYTAQGGLCAICLQPETQKGKNGEVITLAVDHDHSCCPGKKTCGKCIRKLVCKRCNQTMGLLNDDVQLLRRMIDYLT